MIKSVEDLDVFRRSYDLALHIHKASSTFPDIEKFGMASQVRRASKGICANIAEGYGKQSRSTPEFKRFLSMAAGSCEEMRLWLNFCKDLEYITEDEFERWYTEYDEIIKMLHGLMNKWK